MYQSLTEKEYLWPFRPKSLNLIASAGSPEFITLQMPHKLYHDLPKQSELLYLVESAITSEPSSVYSVRIEKKNQKKCLLIGNQGYCCYVLKQIDNKISGSTARRTPWAPSSALAALGTLQPVALEILWAVDSLILLSIYYIEYLWCNRLVPWLQAVGNA